MRRLVFAWAVPALVALASCSSDPAPIEPKATSSAAAGTARPTSTLTPPALPKQATSKDATGAANFVLYWVKVSNYAALTGDTDLLRSISDPACEGCNRYIDLYERTYAAGGYFRGSSWRIDSPKVSESDGIAEIYAHVSAPPGTYKLRGTDKPKPGTPEDVNLVFEAESLGEGWRLNQVVRRSEWTE